MDANKETVKKLKNKYSKVIFYEAPNKIPFEDGSIDYIHVSHLIEHLYSDQLFTFLKEIDRVLRKDGVLVISTPLLWDRFYEDLTHKRPYNPEVLLNYMCGGRENESFPPISSCYKKLDLVYRYRSVKLYESLVSRYFFIDLLISISRFIFVKMGFRKCIKNGYTLILRKD